MRVRAFAVPVAGAGDPTVVLHPDEQPPGVSVGAVGEADHGLHERVVGQRLALLALELDREGLAGGDQTPEIVQRHEAPPYGGESSRTCIGFCIASTER